MAATGYFNHQTVDFLHELTDNNNRDWFEDNKLRYENHVRGPALRFIEDMAAGIKAISPHFLVSAKKSGGSMMRVYRDTRFSKDKAPYKTNIGIQFRHERGKDVHAPGFYFHVAGDGCFLGAGIWRPDSSSLGKIRDRIDERPGEWANARDDRNFSRRFVLSGDSLKRGPAGYPSDHPLLEDLKRKDFIAVRNLELPDIFAPNLITSVAESYATATPFMRFLCAALEVPF